MYIGTDGSLSRAFLPKLDRGVWAALLVLYAFYETYEDNLMEVGHSTPSVPAGQDTTLTHRGPSPAATCLD